MEKKAIMVQAVGKTSSIENLRLIHSQYFIDQKRDYGASRLSDQVFSSIKR